MYSITTHKFDVSANEAGVITKFTYTLPNNAPSINAIMPIPNGGGKIEITRMLDGNYLFVNDNSHSISSVPINAADAHNKFADYVGQLNHKQIPEIIVNGQKTDESKYSDIVKKSKDRIPDGKLVSGSVIGAIKSPDHSIV